MSQPNPQGNACWQLFAPSGYFMNICSIRCNDVAGGPWWLPRGYSVPVNGSVTRAYSESQQ